MKTLSYTAVGLLGLSALTLSIIERAEDKSAAVLSPQVVAIGQMSVDRAAHQATLLQDGRVLVTGGCAGRGCDRVLSSVEIFDPATQSFRSAASMITPRTSHAAVALPDGRVLVSGGWTGRRATAGSEIYDPEADRWTPAGSMKEARASPIAVPFVEGRVLVAGGGSGGLGSLTSAELFDPATSSFSTVSRMKTNHYLGTRLADGRVLVTGGQGDAGEILGSAEIFDPATGNFEPAGNMATARVKHAAALLPDGRVLIIGGSDSEGYAGRFASTEVYHPGTGEFSPGPDMRWGRHKIRDAVVVFPSGGVLVAGRFICTILSRSAG